MSMASLYHVRVLLCHWLWWESWKAHTLSVLWLVHGGPKSGRLFSYRIRNLRHSNMRKAISSRWTVVCSTALRSFCIRYPTGVLQGGAWNTLVLYKQASPIASSTNNVVALCWCLFKCVFATMRMAQNRYLIMLTNFGRAQRRTAQADVAPWPI